MEKPQATTHERDVYKLSKYRKEKEIDGRFVPVREHVGTETIRTGICPWHKDTKRYRPSTDFLGVNENGWLFKCPGNERVDGIDPGPHTFVNLPA